MSSASAQKDVVEQYLTAEVEAGRVMLVGTPAEATVLGIHCSPFGVTPKHYKLGKWQLIFNLSAPKEQVSMTA